jgi:Protein of unknown function (DUF3761)
MSIKSMLSIGTMLLFLPRPSLAQSDSALATARCRDSSYSYSTSRTGTCSGHGGVSEWLATSGATAKCNDGTLSASVSRQGACSRHGGVAEWLIPADARARCGDGTYSSSTAAQGTCSQHGGVAEWFTSENQQDYVAAMKSDLRNLVTAEEVYFADSVRYTTKIGRGGLTFSVTAGNELPSITLTADGWFASIRNANTQTRCMIFVGSTASPPARKEGVPVCTQP